MRFLTEIESGWRARILRAFSQAGLFKELVQRVNLTELTRVESEVLLSRELKVKTSEVNTKLVNEIFAKTNGSPLFMKTILTYLIDTKKRANVGTLLASSPPAMILPCETVTRL